MKPTNGVSSLRLLLARKKEGQHETEIDFHFPSTSGASKIAVAENADVLIVGGGYVGLSSALQLERRLANDASITLVNPENFMLYQPLLPEVASGTIEPRHVVVPLRKTLRRTQVLKGELKGLDPEAGAATIAPIEGEPYTVTYGHVILALGSETRVLPIHGVEDRAVGFQTIAEAIRLRNQILSRMEIAESARDMMTRRRALTFVFVGGGYTGVEALAELEDMARVACRWFPSIAPVTSDGSSSRRPIASCRQSAQS